jgi:nitrogen regulatory protein P-II 1
MYMMIMVLDDNTRLNEVLEAWTEAGIRGVTILESTGLNRIFRRGKADPVYAGFSQIFGGGRVGHNTLFAVVDDFGVAETAVAATEKVLGSLNEPDTGIIFAVPVAKAWGLPQPWEE